MGHIQNAGWVAGDANSPAVLQKTASGWSSGLQMLLVQQPRWLFKGCKAMEAEAWTHPTGREGAMPRQLTSWAVQPARSDGELNSKFGSSMTRRCEK